MNMRLLYLAILMPMITGPLLLHGSNIHSNVVTEKNKPKVSKVHIDNRTWSPPYDSTERLCNLQIEIVGSNNEMLLENLITMMLTSPHSRPSLQQLADHFPQFDFSNITEKNVSCSILK